MHSNLSRALLAFVLLLPLAATAFAQPGTSALHERIDELDHELRRWLARIAEHPEAREPASLEVPAIERHLDELERLAALGAGQELDSKLQALRTLAADLERAVATTAPAPPARSHRRARVAPPLFRNAAPGNDACADAQPIGIGGSDAGTTVGATRDGVASCGSSVLTPDVWYRLSGHDSGYVSIDTFGSDFDTVLSVHRGCPGTQANERVCDDDSQGVHSAASFYAYSGEDYWIRVSGFGGATGAFELHVGRGGTITGRVAAAEDALVLTSGRVTLHGQDGYSVSSTLVSDTGEFSFSGLAAGTYYLKASQFPGYLDELHGGAHCAPGCSVTDGTAVVVNSQETVSNVDFALDRGGSVSGVAVQESTGDPAIGIRIELYDDQGENAWTAVTADDGSFTIGGLHSGTYFAVAESAEFVDELHGGAPCPGGAPYGCDVTAGTPIEVTAPQTTGGVDFALVRLASISGRVTEALTGDPFAGIEVVVRQVSGGSSRYGYTDDAGEYTVGGLSAGTYAAATDNYRSYVDELYSEKPCPGGAWSGSCDPADGTPIVVAAEAAVTGVDFTLDRNGAISGVVTHGGTGDPVANVRIEIWNESWRQGSDYSDSTGAFRVSGLPPGNYYAVTDIYGGQFRNELYQELPCPGGPYSAGCDPTNGTPIVVTVNTTTSGVDFTLDPGGTITGSVTDATTGDPVRYADIEVWDAAGDLVRRSDASFSGNYSIGGLDGGTYYVTARHSSYQEELHDDVACPGGPPAGCDLTTGAPVDVVFNETTSGVDFALSRLGAIAGTVTHAVTGAGVPGVDVKVWNAAGERIGSSSTNSDGDYTVSRLPAGTAYVAAQDSIIVNELYDDLPCGAGCDPTTGTAVAVALDSTVPDVDFEVDVLGAVSGQVTDAVTGNIIYSARVSLWDAAGQFLRQTTASGGSYSFRGLDDGTYHVTATYWDYLNELYDDLPCYPSCDVTAGAPVATALNSEAAGVDFALDRGGAISGGVSVAKTGSPVSGAHVEVWSAAGSYVADGYTGSSGDFTIHDLVPGDYFVVAENGYGSTAFLAQLHLSVPCPGGAPAGCDPTTGTPVAVTANATTENVDFLVDLLGSLTGSVFDENGEPIAGLKVRAWNSAGDAAGSATTGFDGEYKIGELTPGSYYLSTSNSLGYLDELHDDVPCLGGAPAGCDPTKGVPVAVAVDAATRVDFELGVFGGVSGTVTDRATGAPMAGVLVDAWSLSGNRVAIGLTSAAGTYALRVPPGDYYFSTRAHGEHFGQVYPGVACPFGGACDPTTGDAVTVAPEGTTGIDFALPDGTVLIDGFESGDIAAWTSRVP